MMMMSIFSWVKLKANNLKDTKIDLHWTICLDVIEKKINEYIQKGIISGKKLTLKKYRTRKSPPYPANDYCNKKKKGNDGFMYISKPNKNKVCSWKKV